MQHPDTFLDVAAADEHEVNVLERLPGFGALFFFPESFGHNTLCVPAASSRSESAVPKPRSSWFAAPT